MVPITIIIILLPSIFFHHHLHPHSAMLQSKPRRLFGQKPFVLLGVWGNVVSWIVKRFFPSLLPRLLPPCPAQDKGPTMSKSQTRCISVGRPGGMEQLRVITLKPGIMTCGYNVQGQDVPFTKPIHGDADLPPDCVVLRNEAFSVNYADCCIRCVSCRRCFFF